MPTTPFPVTGKVKDFDGTTNVDEGKVYLDNITQGVNTNGEIQSDGSFSMDLANAGSYSDNDILVLSAESLNGLKSATVIGKLDTDNDVAWDQNLYYKSIPLCRNSNVYLLSAAFTSNQASVAEFIDKKSGIAKLRMPVTSNGFNSWSINDSKQAGLKFQDGMFVIVMTNTQTKTANSLTAGVSTAANILGDKASNKLNFVSISLILGL